MFGYVNADKPNMLMKDYAEYRAYYCGLCKSLGRRYSPLTRFTVNYDITFLSLIAHNYNKLTPVFKEGRCAAHPVGKKFPIAQDNPVTQKVCDINIILGYYKALDDVLDGGGIKYLAARAFLKAKFNRARKRLPELDAEVKKNYCKLRELEKAKEANIDKLADCFAVIMQAVGRTACGGYDDKLDNLCYNLGRWVYLIDAYDDLESDLKEGKFNPLLPEGTLDAQKSEEIYEKVKYNLLMSVAGIREAYDAMDIKVSEGPLSNIVYCGLKARTDMILERRGAKCKKTLSRRSA